jgi:hypothetical protein
MSKTKQYFSLSEIVDNSGFSSDEIKNALEAAGNIDAAYSFLNNLNDGQGRKIYRSEVRGAAKLLTVAA